uniref:Uncharacterized protein n=1 Tax=Rangifer tarandus platyrhynchus TaxID=3082113 RepID=A0ACB0F7R9_RANTA|nr:unnamed protein product [Rangifer tarandus platyrhynchus]
METDSGQLQQKGVERSSLSEEPDALELSQSFARISLQSDEGAPGPPALWGRGGGGARRDHVRTTWRTPSPRAVPDPGRAAGPATPHGLRPEKANGRSGPGDLAPPLASAAGHRRVVVRVKCWPSLAVSSARTGRPLPRGRVHLALKRALDTPVRPCWSTVNGMWQWASPLHSSNKQVLLQCSDLPRIKCSDYEGDCAVPAKLATPLIISECPGALEMAVQDGN